MNRLKTILLSDSSKYIHLALTTVLFTLVNYSYLAILLLIAEVIYLSKKSKNLLIYALLIGMLIFLRFSSNTDYNQGQAIIVGIEDNKILVKDDKLLYLYLDNTADYEIGMMVDYSGEEIIFDQKNIPGVFNYESYLRSRNVFSQIRVKSIEVTGYRFSLRSIPEKLKNYFDDSYSKTSSSYLKLFILGHDQDMQDEIKNQTRKLGVSHLFAISGMHLALVVGFISYLLNFFFLRKRTHQIIIGVFLVFYNIITGFSISIVRATLLSLALFLKSDKGFTKTDYLSFIIIGFLLYNPYLIKNVSFQLSFLISFCIILGNNLIASESKTTQILKIGALATLVSLPISLNLNGTFGVMNIIYNVVFVFFVTIVFLPMSFACAGFSTLEGVYLDIIAIFEGLVKITYRSNYYVSFQFVSEIFIILYWISLFCLLMLFKTKYRSLFAISIISVFMMNFANNFFEISTYVRMLDVNQAEAIHLHSGKCDILVDTGDIDEYNSVITYFNKKNIKELDYLIITHQHQDHYGEAKDIVDSLDVKNIMVNNYYPDLADYNQKMFSENQNIKCGDFEIYNLSTNSSENENNNSLVLLALVGKDKWLFTGDIEAVKETEIINKYSFDLDVLKVAHHGSNTSTTNEFLERTRPEYALISAGNNGYDHPASEVTDRLTKNKIKYFVTKNDGTITFYYIRLIPYAIIETKLSETKAKYQIKT